VTVAAVADWLRESLGELLDLPPNAIDVHAPLAELEVDSLVRSAMTVEIEDRLGIELDPAPLRHLQTVWEIAEFLVGMTTQAPGASVPAAR
jgi:acyl carrier protein